MSEKLFLSLQHHPDSLDIRLKEINSFNISIQNIEGFKNFYNLVAKKYEKESKTNKNINGLFQSIDGVLVLSTSSTCITLSNTGVGLVIVPIASGIGAGVCMFRKIFGEYLKI